MRRGLTGQYRVTQVAGETIRAFVPYSLPPDPPLIFDAQRQQLLERATLYARSQASAVIHIRRILISLTKVPKRCERKWCASGRFRCKVE